VPSADVLHVCFGGLGGHLSVVNTLTRELGAVGVTSGVVAVAPAEAIASTAGSWTGVEFVEPVAIRRRADLASMWTALQAGRRIRSRVVVMHTLRHTTPIALGRLATRQPLHLVTRESHSLPSRSWIVNVQSASSVMWGQAVVFLTAENMAGYPLRHLPLRGLRRRRVIPNGVDVERFRFRPRGDGMWGDPITIGMAARFVPGKDFASLVRVIAALREEWGDRCPRLILAGDGPTHASVRALVDELGVNDRVELLGHVPESQIPEFLDRLDIYAQLTDGEAFSMSLIQACAAGLPIIASNVPGVRDVFTDHEDALLVEPRLTEPVVAAIRSLVEPGTGLAARLGAAAHRLGVERYSSRRMAASYLELFAELDSEGPWLEARGRLADRA